MKPRSDRLLLVAGLASVAVGVWLLVAPETVSSLGPLDALTDTDTATRVGLLVGLVVAALAAFQMRKTARETLDRSDLLPAPPERARDVRVPAPSAPLARGYRQLGNSIDQLGPAGWQVVAYGRRARETLDQRSQFLERRQREPPAGRDIPDHPPERGQREPPAGSNGHNRPPGGQRDRQQRAPPEADRGRRSRGTGGQPFGHRGSSRLLALLDEVALTARDTYAAATGCEEETAERAVETGEWTDDRIAAAFLATEQEGPSFTIGERAVAWLAPRRTFDRRLGRTLDAIETHAEGFLTYRTPSTDWTETGGGLDSNQRDDPAGGAGRNSGGPAGRPGRGRGSDGVPAGPAGEEKQ